VARERGLGCHRPARSIRRIGHVVNLPLRPRARIVPNSESIGERATHRRSADRIAPRAIVG
jgi:hypothetical protein